MAFVLLAPLLGCGGGSSLDLAPVSGTVTYRGKPLDHGSVSFMPTGDTRGPQAAAEIQADGTFSMKTAGKEGAVVGTHKVIVQCRRAVTPVEAKNLIIGELLIPMKYTEFGITPLSINVKSGKNEYPIELK
ncbi:MAG: hypothetical protein JXM70_26655 [Pirellulales bacterium]|nr:hypothetical protein [Pirellulales bacterium]